MSLTIGARLGPYEITGAIGAGGMGEVYKARDPRLGRTVAIKVLSRTLASSESLRTLESEARAVASLNHPHVCALYDIGVQDDVEYMVMELLDGETLSDRLRSGPLPLHEALRHAIAVASALEHAHRRGIVHRDIKPGNVMLTNTGVKLLDFGLARLRPEVAAAGPDLAATMSVDGLPVLRGTPQYMAPEQIEGREADGRSDIFAFGTVLYEMLSGQRAFRGDSYPALVAAILKGDPPLLPSGIPPPLARTLSICWAKLPDDRWQSAGDLRRELEWTAEGGGQGAPTPPLAHRRVARREFVAWSAAAAFGASGTAALVRSFRGSRVESTPGLTFQVESPRGATMNPFATPPAVSPDGRLVAFAAGVTGSELIRVRPLDSTIARALPGTEGANCLFWSPDSRSIGFWSPPNLLKRVEVLGGVPQTVCQTRDRALGGSWNRDGVIIFNMGASDGVGRVPASGGVPTEIVSSGSNGEPCSFPCFLPDGRNFLYTLGSIDGQRQGIYLGSLGSKDTRRLLPALSNAAYAPGRVLYAQDGKLFAHPFDAAALALSDEPRPIAEGLWSSAGPGFLQAAFSVSSTGVLVYGQEYIPPGQPTWVDRSGRRTGVAGPAGPWIHLDLSPDDSRVLLERLEAVRGGLWILDLTRGDALSRVTSGPAWAFLGYWSPDGRRIAYSADDGHGKFSVYQRDADGASAATVLVPQGILSAWASSGLVFSRSFPTPDGFGVLAPGSREPIHYLVNQSDAALATEGHLSPDGRWMAYSSTESKVSEIYVRPFPSAGAKRLISSSGGARPKWRSDGKELFYLAPDGNLMAVPTVSGSDGSLIPGPPRPLFSLAGVGYAARYDYAVARDGQRFLVNSRMGPPISYSLTVKTGSNVF